MWPGLREVGRDRDAEQAGLDLAVDLVSSAAVAVDGQDAGERDPAVDGPVRGRGVPDVDVAAADADVAVGEVEDAAGRPGADHLPALRVGAAVGAADVEDPAVGRGRDAVRLAGVRQVAASSRRPGAGRCSWRRWWPCSRRGPCRRSTGSRRAGGSGSRAGRSSPRSGPCRCRRSGRPGSRGTTRSASRCRRCRCRRRPERSGRGSGRRCGPDRWAGSATRTRRPGASTRAAASSSRDGRGRRPRRPSRPCRSGCPPWVARRSGCRRRCCRARSRRRRRCRRSRRRR